MQGLELSRKYFEEHGKHMLAQFPHLLPYIAVGVVGCGSECLGYDDQISRDHDFSPGFCIFIPGEEYVSSKDEFQLERAYAKLPKEFQGYHVAASRNRGVMRIDDFVNARFIGLDTGSLTPWFCTDEQHLLELTNGELFMDNLGRLTAIRNQLKYFPDDVRFKKLVGYLMVMAQSGQYNYPRCIARQDTAAAQLAVGEFVNAAMHVVFLLNKQYMPYYKWSFRAMRGLPKLSELALDMEFLLSHGNTEQEVQTKQALVERIVASCITEIRTQGLSHSPADIPEPHAWAINNLINDNNIRNQHIMYAI